MDFDEKDPAEIYDQMVAERLKINEVEHKRWSDYKKNHEKVIEGLEVIPKELSLNCMVPIGKRALIKGRLVHTNEILVCLGDGYFAKYSATQAIALCQRRIKKAEEMLERVKNERDFVERQKLLPDNLELFADSEREGLVEHWDDEKLDEWRVLHRQREKEYRKRMKELKEKEENDAANDYLAKLDALGMNEENEQELEKIEDENDLFLEDDEYFDESEVDSESYSSDYSEEATNEVPDRRLLKINHRLQVLNNVNKTELNNDFNSKLTDSKLINENDIINEEVNTKDELNNKISHVNTIDIDDDVIYKIKITDNIEKSKIKEKKVVFAEPQVKYFSNDDEMDININDKKRLSVIEQRLDEYSKEDDESEDESDEDDTIRIYFKHSDNEINHPASNNDEILSPRDIYKRLPSPKSILKKTLGDINYSKQSSSSISFNSTTDDESFDDTDRTSAYNTIIKDIQERTIVEPEIRPVTPDEQKRPVSKFKLERAGLKK